MDSDVTHLIERLDVFEERESVRVEALFAHIDPYGNLTVNGEVHPREGANIKHDIVLHVDVCDSSGRIVAKHEVFFPADKFFGFAVFQTRANVPVRELSRIRVYPKQYKFTKNTFVVPRLKHIRVDPKGNQLTYVLAPPSDLGREFEALVVGIKYHRRHTDGLNIGDLVQLVREPENIYDSNAVQVKVLYGELLGYIASELAATLAEEIDAGMCVQARISRFSSSRKAVYLAVIVGRAESNVE